MNDDDDEDAEDVEQSEPEPGTPDSAADPRRIKKQRRRQELDEREEAQFWERAFADPVGRRVLWKILVRAGITSERFGAGPTGFPDPLATWFRAGGRAVADGLLQDWTIRDFAGVHQMLIEHHPQFPKPTPDKADR